MTTTRTAADYDDIVAALQARRPAHMVPGLERIRALCASLGHPQRSLPAIHVTGTNGKTSISRIATSLLTALDVHTGTYTSPHLQDIRERVRLDGRLVSRDVFAQQATALAPHIDAVEHRRGEVVTFFEALTALAYRTFAEARVEAAVVEVGMGGRWDATNVLDARVAVVNRVGLDHPELGTTVAQVATEKAGIVKPGADVVSAHQEPAAAEVVRRAAAAQHATLHLAGRDFGVVDRTPVAGGQRLVLQGLGRTRFDVWLPLIGGHQAANAACALAAVQALLGDAGLDPAGVRAGMAGARSPGRLEVFRRPGAAPVVLDGAHNPDGAQALAEALREELSFRRCVAVVGMSGDKDVPAVLCRVLGVADDLVVTAAPTPRAAPPEHLAALVRATGRAPAVAADVPAALDAAAALAGPGDLVVVTGSLYTVGAARQALGGQPA